MKNWFSNRGRYYERGTTTPQKGDLVIFKYSSGDKHIGLVTGADSSTVYTIEGNTSNMVASRSYSLSNSTIHGYCRPAYASAVPPTNVHLDKNQIWYDIQDTIELTPYSDNATEFYMSVRRQESWEEVISTSLNGTYSISASSLGYGDYYAWITASNSAGSTDSQGITFSIVGAPSYGDVWSDKKIFTTSETIWITVSSVCAKGHVIGIDKDNVGRVITEECGNSYGIQASDLGVGTYSAYFSVYNGSGSVDTKRISFEIVEPINYGDEFYAYVINDSSQKYMTNNNGQIVIQSLIPSDNQKWHFMRNSDGSYKIQSVKDEKYLDVEFASDADGAKVQVYENTESTAQKWFILSEDGHQYLASQCSNGRLDVANNETKDGTIIQMYSNKKTSAQQFTVYRIDDKCPTYATLTTEKNTYDIGETINFTSKSDYSTGIWLSVLNQNGTVINGIKVTSEYSHVFEEPGEYTAWISAANKTGSVDSQRLYFTVEDTQVPTPETYTVTLNANGGTINSGNITSYTYGKGATLPTNVTRDGYTFRGWYDNASFTGSAVTSISSSETGNKVYYAKWEQNAPAEYTITFVNYDGSVLQSGDVTAGTMPVYSGVTPTREADSGYSYTFSGWSPALSAASGNKTYTAQFTRTARVYSIRYNMDDGAINSGIVTSYTYGIGAALPTDVSKPGYIFNGWYAEPDFSGSAVMSIAAAESGSKVFYAKWTQETPSEYLISFVNYDNSVLQSSYVPVGEIPAYYGAEPEREADSEYTYTFAGWEPEIEEVSGVATYTAKYDAVPIEYSYSIKYDVDKSCAIVTVAETGTYTVIFAAYDANGTLTSIETKNMTFDSKGIHLIYSDTFKAAEASTIKVML